MLRDRYLLITKTFKGYYYVEIKEQDDKELLGAMGRVVYK